MGLTSARTAIGATAAAFCLCGWACAAKKEIVDRDRPLVETLVPEGHRLESLTGDLADGVRSLRDGELDEAKAALERWLDKHPNSALAAYHLGLWALAVDKRTIAQNWFERAVEFDPKLHAAHCHLGALYLGQGEDVAALRALEKAYALAPDDVRVLANLGAARSRRGLWSEALEAYQAANKIAPSHGSLLYDTALVWMQRYQWQQALDLLEQALSVRPYFGQAWAAKVACLHGLGDLAGAEAAARAAMDALGQPEAEVHLAYARVLVQLRKIGDAIDQLRTAAQLRPEHAGVQLALGELLDAAGRKQEALAVYQTYLKNPQRLGEDGRRIRDRAKQLQSGKAD
ncbi:MAG: tetratricopeptide repeat protein [Deltaproteobacteria bacterium]|nr:tetratricopeptide repeat protein [Deltaproteobacteria bacterium]